MEAKHRWNTETVSACTWLALVQTRQTLSVERKESEHEVQVTTTNLFVNDSFLETENHQWVDAEYIKQAPGQTPCSGVAGQHKSYSMFFTGFLMLLLMVLSPLKNMKLVDSEGTILEEKGMVNEKEDKIFKWRNVKTFAISLEISKM